MFLVSEPLERTNVNSMMRLEVRTPVRAVGRGEGKVTEAASRQGYGTIQGTIRL